MKTKSLLLASLLCVIGGAAFAQANPVAQVARDNAQIHQDGKAIRQDSRAIHQDTAVIAAKKADVANSKQALQAERGERNALQHAERADLRKGDLAGAQQMAQAKHAEQQNVNATKHEIKQDKTVIANRKVDRHEVVVARKDEKSERHTEVVKRDIQAGKI